MATTPMHLTVLYQEALDAVTATPENWLAFLQSAGRNYRYPFQDQLLIHHQRPNAVAVLTYAQWEQRFGRRARRGSTGIAVFGRSRGRTQVQYYFDVQDTYPTPNARPVPLWSVEPGDSGLLLKLLTEKFSVTAPVLPIAIFEVSKTYTSAVISANWEVLQDAEIPVSQDAFQRLVENSVSYLLLRRLGMEDYARFYPTDFDALEQFRTPEAVHLLGDTVNAASRDILTEIAATIRAVHLHGSKFFAESQTSVYDESTTEQNEPEKGGQNHGDDIQSGKRHETAELDGLGGTDGDGQVRNAAGTLSPGTPAQSVSEPADQRDAEPAPDGGPAPGIANVGGPDAPASAGDGRDGSAEGQRSHDLGGADEQSQTQRRRDDPGGAGVQLSFKEPEPSVNAPGSFSVPEQEDHQLSMFEAGDASAQMQPQAPSADPADEMLCQAELAAKMSEETGQNLFAFEAGNPFPINLPKSEDPKAVPEILEVNFHITDDALGRGSVRQKYAANITAIKLLKKLEQDGRNATPEEQEILSHYVGWGGMPQAFDSGNTSWSSEYVQLKKLLIDEEYNAARESTLNAHYTSPTVIKAIYEALGNLGFTSGNILEPACGVGNFFGLLPKTMQDSKLYGVELDSISGRIAKKLYPQADITVAGFETTDRRNFYDLAIGNVPFGQYQVNDKAYNNLGFNIHNYFIAKAIDQVRPGGILAFVTSRYTMDAKGPEVRRYIAERAKLLGAIRLPNNAFWDNAGTSVVSDILFLQKRERIVAVEPDWVYLGKTEDGLTINNYFIDNPEMVLGELTIRINQYGREECTVSPLPDVDLGQQLHEVVQHIHGQYLATELDFETEVDDSIPADPNVKNFSFTLYNDAVYYRENSRMKPVPLSTSTEQRIRSLIELRDCAQRLIGYETDDFPEEDIQRQQAELNRLYDSFQAEYGIINSKANRQAFSEDDSYYLLCSLEILDDEQNFQRKADIFTKRTIRPKPKVSTVETAQEALMYCLNDRAWVDMGFMAALTGKHQDTLEQELTGQIFRLPAADSEVPTFVLAEEYLSGNVREKLAEARDAAAENPIYAANVTALEQVQPQDLSAAEISVRLGSTWVPEADVEQFIYDLLKPAWYQQKKIRVHYSSYTGAWQIDGKSIAGDSIYASSTYGTNRTSAYHIIEDSLNLREVRVFDYVKVNGKRNSVLNKKETALAQGKQSEIKQAFQDWIWKDPARRQRLTTLYNKKFNNIRPREYNGSHLVFPGMNPEIILRLHQKNAIARALYGGNTLLAHCVGAGKTFEMVAIAQESKRLGLCQKSMVVVPNHLIGQWSSEYLQLYPAANILVATEKDFTPARRKTFCSRIATGDYDAVIIGHSQFEKIPLSTERQVKMLKQQIDDIVSGIAEAKREGNNQFTIKQLERVRKRVQTKLQKLNDQSRKDDVVTFEELGVDRLFIDEAHIYKNLAVVTKMQNVSGISQTESQRASDMFLKCRYLDELTNGRGVIFATGTPISNTMVEMYTMQRYLQYRTLESYGLAHFDAWAANFGETVTAIELSPEGTGYRTKTRFARFYNLPELIYMFRMVADIRTADMLKLPVPKANYHVEQLEPSELQKKMVQELSVRADKVRNKMVSPQEDNMLRITGDGRKLALDQRLMNPLLPDDENSKSAACARNVYDIWLKTADNKGAQIIFCDLSTPHFDGKFNLYDDLWDKLTAMGIPREEIVFIHEAPTEAKKKVLFAKVRSGQVRVLIGSTAKMGTGTNVQTRLTALHDADCPWRPSDLEQRSGRIIRQGNTYETVDIYRYVTKDTFDAYLWVRHEVA